MKKPNLKNKIIALIMAGVMTVSAAVFGFISWINKKMDKANITNKSSITEMEEATEILEYIDVSEGLKDMNNTYGISQSTLKKYEDKNISLDTPNALQKEIECLSELMKDKNTLTTQKQEEIIERIARMMMQEKLVNEYLYNSYSTVNTILESALREYVGEKYGISDTENIKFACTGYGENTRYNIHYDQKSHEPFDGKICEGIYALEQTTTYKDPNPNDNDQYNKDRNKILNSSLSLAEKLQEETQNKDLYSKRLAKKLR